MNQNSGGEGSARRRVFLLMAALLIACAITVFLWRNRHATTNVGVTQNPKNATTARAVTTPPANSNIPPAIAGSVQTSATSTASSSPVPPADGKDITSIRKWAHNELEVDRMLKENDRIYRRQLVTLKETAAAAVERHRLTGEPIRELTLPGLDGSEIHFQVTAQDLEPSGLRGTFRGNVVGLPGSMVTLAFLQGRQAYTVISPTEHLYLDVEPHDPGDVIMKSINLDKYNAWVCGNQ